MNITYHDNLDLLAPDQLNGFFVGWPSAPSAERHFSILKGSHKVWLAMDGDRCVGFINALSDGIFSAFIPLLEVLPEYQNRGIGTELVRRMVTSLDDHYSIDAVCDQDVVKFYDRQGFVPLTAVSKRNYHRQKS